MCRISKHGTRLRFWARAADLLGLGLITWRPDDDGGWFCFASQIGVPHVARGSTAADALRELVKFARKIR
jgi:hypothetical protein